MKCSAPPTQRPGTIKRTGNVLQVHHVSQRDREREEREGYTKNLAGKGTCKLFEVNEWRVVE